MKKTIFSKLSSAILGMALLFITSMGANAQTWKTPLELGGNYNNQSMRETFFISPSQGWAVGVNGIIRTTNNGGITWTAQTSGTNQTLNSVFFTSSTQGWAVGVNGIIRTTSNGGITWTAQASGTTQTLSSVYFTSATQGWVVGDGDWMLGKFSAILTTINGGATWTAQTSGTTQNLSSVYFTSATQGWAVGQGGTILTTSNSGTTWTAQTSGTYQELSSVYFNSATQGWAVSLGNEILTTNNGGATWSVQTSAATLGLYSIKFTSASQGWAVGGDGTILTTNNGGATWTSQTSGTKQILYSVYFTSPTQGWAVGDGGITLTTSNAGATWTAQLFGSSQFLLSVYFTSATQGWVVGSAGTILVTSNGGTVWTPQISGTTQHLNSVNFTSATQGWVVGNGGTILTTTNGGVTWNTQISGTTQRLASVYLTSSTKGWAVGDGGTILTTSNGGITWTAQTSGTTNNLNSVYFTSATQGWAAGVGGTILSTNNGGATWTAQTSGTTQILRSVYFISATQGWVVGNSGTILTTSNGGTTWTAQTSLTSQVLLSVYFTSFTQGWAVGGSGTILTTSNGGTTWTVQNSGTTRNLYSVYSTSPTRSWAVGDIGTILLYDAPPPPSTWNGTTWSPSAPDATTNAIINGNYSTLENGIFTAKDLTINAGQTLTIASGTTLAVSGNLINNGKIIRCGTLTVTGTTSGTGTVETSKYKIDPQTVLCTPAGTFSVPVKTVGNISSGLIALDFDLLYDDTKVTPTGTATVGPVATTFATFDLNSSTPGKVGIGLYLNGAPANTFFSGDGVVINVNFRINTGVAPNQALSSFSTSDLIESKLFTSNVVCPVVPGAFNFTRAFNGQIQYRETATKKISGVTGQNPTTITPYSTTDATGIALTSPSLDANGLFTVPDATLKSLTFSRDVLGDASVAFASCANITTVINAADRTTAAQIANGVVTAPTIFQLLAADVNLDGRVTSGDAALISSRGLNQYNCEFPQSWNYEADANGILSAKVPYAKSKDWLFVDATLLATTPFTTATRFKVPAVPAYLPVSADLSTCGTTTVDQTYHAVLLGDVNSSWLATNGATLRTEKPSNVLVLSLKDISANDQYVAIPVSYESNGPSAGIDFAWDYDRSKFNVTGYDIAQPISNKMASLSNNVPSAQRLMATTYVLKDLVETKEPIAYIYLAKNSGTAITKDDFNSLLAVVNGEVSSLRVEESEAVTGVQDLETGSLSLYPNPASKTIYIQGLQGTANIEIHTATGQLQQSGTSNGSIDLSNLEKGVYFVKVSNPYSSKVHKVVVE